jgi:hypothetical protein
VPKEWQIGIQEMLRILWTSILIALALTACIVPSSPGIPIIVTAENEGIAYSLEMARNTYSSGESARITYRVTNKTESVVNFGSVPNCESCIYQMRAAQGAREVWRTCRVMPPCGYKEFVLQAHETQEWVVDWNLTNDNGTLEPEDDFPLSAGRYTLTVNLWPSNEPPLLLSLEIEIR